MLGLGHEVSRHHDRVGGRVCQDADLGGPGDHVDAHVAGDVALGCRHVGVAGAHDLVDAGDGLGAIGHGANRLRAAHGIDLVDARHRGCCQRICRERAVVLWRRHHDHAAHARNLCRDGVHEHRRGVLRATARHVDGHGVERRHLHAQDGAVGPRLEPGVLALTFVELANLAVRATQGREELGIHHAGGGVYQLLRDAELARAGAVEALAVLTHGLVAPLAHVVHDGGGALHHLAGKRPRAVEICLRECLTSG